MPGRRQAGGTARRPSGDWHRRRSPRHLHRQCRVPGRVRAARRRRTACRRPGPSARDRPRIRLGTRGRRHDSQLGGKLYTGRVIGEAPSAGDVTASADGADRQVAPPRRTGDRAAGIAPPALADAPGGGGLVRSRSPGRQRRVGSRNCSGAGQIRPLSGAACPDRGGPPPAAGPGKCRHRLVPDLSMAPKTPAPAEAAARATSRMAKPGLTGPPALAAMPAARPLRRVPPPAGRPAAGMTLPFRLPCRGRRRKRTSLPGKFPL